MFDLKQWALNKLAKPLIPALQQSVKVLVIVEAKIKQALEALKTLGITIDGSVLNNINNVLTAISVVQVVLNKILEFIGAPVEAQTANDVLAQADLDAEIEKLKKLI